MVKKILLIYPNNEKMPYPVPPIGLSLLASVLKEKYRVLLFDGMFGTAESLTREINGFKPDYIGISIRNIDNVQVDNIVYYVDGILNHYILRIRKITDVPVILGGSGFSIFPGELMELLGADYGVVGEGEELFLRLLSLLDRGKPGRGIPGIIEKDRGVFEYPLQKFNIKKLPHSEIDGKIDFAPYRERSSYPIQTKRGCSHKCIYCTYPEIEGKTYRTRDPEDIAEEIAEVHGRLGDITFEFVDSTFNDPPGHAEAICSRIVKKGLKIKLRAMGINPAHASRELFSLMLKAGFSQIDCTPDTASETMIANFQKNFSLEELKRTALLIREFRIPVMWFFIFGGPGETEKTIAESFDFIDRYIYKYDLVHISTGLRIYPNTPLYRIALKEGVISRDNSILYPEYYVNKKLGQGRLKGVIEKGVSTRFNCLTSSDSKPAPEMMEEALELRRKTPFDEPMFRTLLRLREKTFSPS